MSRATRLLVSNMAYRITQKILSAIEREITGDTPVRYNSIEFLKIEYIYPIKLLCAGLDVIGKGYMKFNLTSFLGLCLLALVFSRYEPTASKDIYTGFVIQPLLILFGLILPFLVSVFSTLTSRIFSKRQKKCVDCVVHILNRENTSVDQLKQVRANIEEIERRIFKPLSIALRTFLAIFWTGLVYIFSNSIQPYLIEERIQNWLEYSNLKSVVLSISFGFIAISTLYLLIESYLRINDMIFRSAQLGCNEYEFHLYNK
ncbi:hypothetical protein [Synechococcus sp. PCC 7336]|uniref:hypothetical protein n=1 Tax=Synechococcus sp. PCC 7336 TaxID=195250 RepID=UPI0012EAF776|nr:hypothetical protein [Synechococcus sp. PCC 7336]